MTYTSSTRSNRFVKMALEHTDSGVISPYIMFVRNMIYDDKTTSEQEKSWLDKGITVVGREKLLKRLTPNELEEFGILQAYCDDMVKARMMEIKEVFFASITSGDIKAFGELIKSYPCCGIPHSDILDACIQSRHANLLKHYVAYRINCFIFKDKSVESVINRLFEDKPLSDKWNKETFISNNEMMTSVIREVVQV